MQWMVRCTTPNGDRSPLIELPPHLTESQRTEARAAAVPVSAIVRGGGLVADTVTETVAEYAARWLADREGRIASIEADRARMRMHVLVSSVPSTCARSSAMTSRRSGTTSTRRSSRGARVEDARVVLDAW
jgi:hypothetical protein